MKRASSWLLAVAALFAAASCGDTSTRADAAESLLVAAPPGVLERLAEAPFDTAYVGRRRLEFHVPSSDGTTWSLIAEERVASDGAGRFAVDPLALIEPPLPRAERESFEFMQKARQGFLYRYRDFRVRDLALAAQSWAVRDLGTQRVVAQQTCIELELRRQNGAGSTYVAAVDPRSGLVLAWTERARDGGLLAVVEFQEIAFTAPPADTEWAAPDARGSVLDDSTQALGVVGFEPATPRLLPQGFRRGPVRWRDEAGTRFAWREFSDGVETLFVVHGRPLDANGAVAAALPVPFGPAGSAALVRVCSYGAWTVAEHVRAGGEVILAFGKVGEDEIVRTLQSAL